MPVRFAHGILQGSYSEVNWSQTITSHVESGRLIFSEKHLVDHLFRMGDAFGAFFEQMIFGGRVTLTHPPPPDTPRDTKKTRHSQPEASLAQTCIYCSRIAGQMVLLRSLIHGPTPRKDRTSIGRNTLAHPPKHQILGTQSGMCKSTWKTSKWSKKSQKRPQSTRFVSKITFGQKKIFRLWAVLAGVYYKICRCAKTSLFRFFRLVGRYKSMVCPFSVQFFLKPVYSLHEIKQPRCVLASSSDFLVGEKTFEKSTF